MIMEHAAVDLYDAHEHAHAHFVCTSTIVMLIIFTNIVETKGITCAAFSKAMSTYL